jgi:gamma-glutamyltranspeptidase/glutathione hydrolase
MTFDPCALSSSPSRGARPVIRGNTYAISTRKPQATQAAERILRAGGNAFDAAVAAQAVLSVVDPHMTGVGGDAAILVYVAAEQKIWSINAAGTAPALASIEWFERNAGGKIPANDGLLCASLPTVIDACYTMLDRWGTMTFADALAPAIELAENGFPVSEYFVEYLVEWAGKLRKYPTTARIFLPGGGPPAPGANMRNPDLARTLRRIVDAEQRASGQGRRGALRAARDLFYRGEIAREMAAFIEANGGLYRYDDFANYSVALEEPVSVNYRGLDVYKNPSACQGPTELLLLNMLEGFDLKTLGHNTPEYIHVCVEAAKLAYADRERYLADANFVPIPFDRLLSKEYAAERRALIDPVCASLELRPGEPVLTGMAAHEGDTSYVAVVDKDRNGVSFTPSLHSAFGTGMVLGDLGFMLNCRGDLYHLDRGHPNAIAPGKRPRTTLTPTIVMKDAQPLMMIGSPGGDDQPLRIAQTLLNFIDFGMNIQQAIEAPRWTTTSFPASEFPHTMYPGQLAVEDRIPPEVRASLAKRGHQVEVRGGWILGATCAIFIDPASGVLSAGADPRGDNYALAW